MRQANINKINPNDIVTMAERLIHRYGKQALEIARERVDEAEFGVFPSEKDIAFHVLTQVEHLLGLF